MPDRLELLVLEQVVDILPTTGEEVVQAYDVVALCQEAFAEVRADEAGTAGYEDAHNPDRVYCGVDSEAVVCASDRFLALPGSLHEP